MMIDNKRIGRAIGVFLSAFTFSLAVAGSAHSQWVPPRGEGSLSIEYRRIDNTDHIFSDLYKARNQPSGHDQTAVSGNVAVMSLDYAIYDRLALSVSLPFVNTELQSDNAHGGDHSADTAANNAFQDLGVGLRYMILTDPLFVTTSLGLTLPTHDYGTHGHSAIGRNIRVLSVGAGVARMLSPILTGVYVQGNYSYSVTEEVVGISMERSNASVGVTYFPRIRSLSLTGYLSYQNTHGGVDWSDPGFETHPEWSLIHDRIGAEDFGTIGGNVSFSVTDRLGVFAGYFRTFEALSQNTQRLSGISIGTTTSY